MIESQDGNFPSVPMHNTLIAKPAYTNEEKWNAQSFCSNKRNPDSKTTINPN